MVQIRSFGGLKRVQPGYAGARSGAETCRRLKRSFERILDPGRIRQTTTFNNLRRLVCIYFICLLVELSTVEGGF